MSCGFRSVLSRVDRVLLRSMRVVGLFLVASGFLLLASSAMVLGSLFVLVGGARMMMSAFDLVCTHPVSSCPALTRTTVYTINGFLLAE